MITLVISGGNIRVPANISGFDLDDSRIIYEATNGAASPAGLEAILYDPPIDEFAVVRLALNAKGAKATFDPISGPTIIIFTQGSGKISVGPKSEEVKVRLLSQSWVAP